MNVNGYGYGYGDGDGEHLFSGVFHQTVLSGHGVDLKGLFYFYHIINTGVHEVDPYYMYCCEGLKCGVWIMCVVLLLGMVVLRVLDCYHLISAMAVVMRR